MAKTKIYFEFKNQSDQSADVYIYDEISSWGVHASEFVNNLKDIKSNEINLYLNSPGGSVFEGLTIYNALVRHQAKINVHIDGLAASIASVIAMAGDTITMPDNAIMMIHNPWSFAMGESDDMRKTADVLDKLKDSLISIYSDRTGLNYEEISTLMDDETWLSASEAQSFGFADNITDSIKIAAQYDLGVLGYNIPEHFENLLNTEQPKEEDIMTNNVQSGSDIEPKMDVEAIKAEAVAAERKRIADIQKLPLAECHGSIVNKAIESGLDAGETALAILAAESEVQNRAKEQVVNDLADPIQDEPVAEPVSKDPADLYDTDESIKAEFPTKELYLAYLKAEEAGMVRKLSKKDD